MQQHAWCWPQLNVSLDGWRNVAFFTWEGFSEQNHVLSHNISDLNESYTVYEGVTAASQTPPAASWGEPDADSPWFTVAVTPPATGRHPPESRRNSKSAKLTRPTKSKVKHGDLSKHRHTNNNNNNNSSSSSRRHCDLILMSLPNVSERVVQAARLAHKRRRSAQTGGDAMESGSRARGNADEQPLCACTLAGIIKFGGAGVF